MKEIDTLKYFALLDEFETANKLIRLGFGELQNINLDNDFYFLPLQLLSQGFERFMKAYICIGHFEKYGILPNYQYLKNLGHDLEKILIDIMKNYYKTYPPTQFNKDREFLTNDGDLKDLLFIISEFGKFARYYNFDFITDNTKIGIDPKKYWGDFETKIKPLDETIINKLKNPDVDKEIYQEITNYIIAVFEKFVASLSRQIVFNTLGQIGKDITINSFFDYGLLYDGDWGKTDYRKSTMRHQERFKFIHKRTFIDEFNRKCNRNFKSKKITKYKYDGDWPFYVDEVIIECRHKHWCIITINGYDYALNGAAKGRYKLENPHEAGMAILGKSISDFIKIALSLK